MNNIEYHYVYYSYEEWGRGYIGSRTCYCLPQNDTNYFGSFKDIDFKPTKKIILKEDYANREEAIEDEIKLHNFYEVHKNLNFANQAKQSSKKFILNGSKAKENGKRTKILKKGIFSRSKEKMSLDGKKSGTISGEKRARHFTVISPSGQIINSKNVSKFCKENKLNLRHFYEVLNGERISHKGFTLINKKTPNVKCIEFIIKSPKGEIIHSKNASKFCKENNIDIGGFSKMLRGMQKSCKGFTLVENIGISHE